MTNTSNRLQSLRDSSVSRRNFVIGSGAAAVGGAALLAACGDDETAPAATTTAAAPATTAAAETGVGTTTLGSNYSDANPKAALAAAVAATGVDTE
ncbi:MAG: hypothetical protein F4131_06140, partial [Acidimicrobiaceae bacterium]|nr:hypothetical protein [Acidimicrobiaceae bacterium]